MGSTLGELVDMNINWFLNRLPLTHIFSIGFGRDAQNDVPLTHLVSSGAAEESRMFYTEKWINYANSSELS